jgi:ketosteroid isomerase-like protein
VIVPGPLSPETIVMRWVDAFNARDIDGILAVLADNVDFHPLRLGGIAASYRGHEGVREWFERLRTLRHEHRVVLREAQEMDGGRVFASGSLSLAGESDIGPFFALHRLEGGLIVAAHQYHTDPGIAEFLGLIR